MNIIKILYLRFIKNIELYGVKNIAFTKSSKLNNNAKIDSRKGYVTLGEHTRIGGYSELNPGERNIITVKDFTTLYTNCKILGQVTIERYCLLATNIYMSSGNHRAFDQPELLIRRQDFLHALNESNNTNINKPIHIHEDVWIGNGVFISGGITIGRGAIIGANSVVTKDVPPYSVVVGTPAKNIKNRLEFSPPSNLNTNNTLYLPYFYQGFDHYNYSTDNENGIQVIDDCQVYLKSGLSKITIIGKCSIPMSLNISFTKDEIHQSFDITKGDFKIDITNVNPTSNYTHLYLTSSIKEYHKHHLFIKQIISNDTHL